MQISESDYFDPILSKLSTKYKVQSCKSFENEPYQELPAGFRTQLVSNCMHFSRNMAANIKVFRCRHDNKLFYSNMYASIYFDVIIAL